MNASALTMDTRASVSDGVLSLPGIVGCYFAARLCVVFLFFQADPREGAAVDLLLNFLMLAAVVFCTYGPGCMTLRSTLRVRTFRWVLAFLGVSFCSLLWSEAASVGVALVYWGGMAADVAMVVLLLRMGPLEGTASALLKGYVCGACLIACIAWLSPTMPDLRPGDDEFFSPNAIGFACAFGTFFAQFLGRSNRAWKLVAGFLAISLLRSLSKTTIAAFIAGELLLLFSDKSIRRRSKVLIIAASAAVVAAFSGLIANYYDVYTNAGNQAETLTGRLGIWTYMLEHALERPWIGHGFDAVRNVVPAFGTFETWHAHNEIIQQFYAYGAVGIFLLFALYGSFYWQLRRVSSSANKALFTAVLLFIVVRGFGDTERFDLSFPLWCIALLSLMLYHSEQSREVAA